MNRFEFEDEKPEPSIEHVPGRPDPMKVYGGDAIPPGSVPVDHQTLARFVQPGFHTAPHGVPPIGIIGLPEGWVVSELFIEDEANIKVLPFRFPFYSRAYALRCGSTLCAVLRNIQPSDLNGGAQVVVQLGDADGWQAIFGRVAKHDAFGFDLEMPDGRKQKIRAERISFVGKVMAWWDESVKSQHTEAMADLADGPLVYEIFD